MRNMIEPLMFTKQQKQPLLKLAPKMGDWRSCHGLTKSFSTCNCRLGRISVIIKTTPVTREQQNNPTST